jgi:hypothetical protein
MSAPPWTRLALVWLPVLLPAATLCADEEPPLPAGLAETQPSEPPLPTGLDDGGDEEEPSLPSGLEPKPEQEEPGLPPGLAPTRPTETQPAPRPAEPRELMRRLGLSGFWEVRGGIRTQHDSHERQGSLGETRMQLDWEKRLAKVTLKLNADLLYDAVDDHHTPRLERGDGFLDLREANLSFSPLTFLDVKVGRQILTWGTGDLLFLNDLFPKDWRAFLIGRDVEYLKAPSDAAKLSVFTELANLDVVFTPRFDADRFIRGRRLSYYSSSLGRLAGRDAVIRTDQPNEWFDDHEWAARVYRTVGAYELAGYGYWGFWKSPAGMDPATGRATFPRLSVYGASLRGPAGKGIGNIEAAYYDSRQDRGGDDPFVANSQVRLLVGYKQDLPRIARDLSAGVQYYLELTMEHGALRRGLPPGAPTPDRARHVLTCRVTKLLMNQNLMLSLFAFYSPSDSDAYLRPRLSYKVTDHWTVDVGGNVFFGARRHTFFGQFGNNTNVYAAVRYGF